MYRRRAFLILALQSLSQSNVGASKISVPLQTRGISLSTEKTILFRGGAQSAPSSSSRKKKKSKKVASQESEPAKNAIANAMEKDSTEALGDAIR